MTGPEQHANTVREALRHLRFSNGQPSLSKAWDANDARAALDALVALAERAPTLESELATATTTMEVAIRKLEAAEERADTLERERDALMADAVKNVNYWKDREYKARAEADRLREALRGADEAVWWIVANHPKVMRELPLSLYQGLLRAAALAGPQTKERASICDECGSGILDGEHIADYPCSRRALAGPQTKEQT